MTTSLKKDDLKAPVHVTTISGVMVEVEHTMFLILKYQKGQRIAGVSMLPASNTKKS